MRICAYKLTWSDEQTDGQGETLISLNVSFGGGHIKFDHNILKVRRNYLFQSYVCVTFVQSRFAQYLL